MNTIKDGFTFYRSFYKQAKHLSDKERHQFYDDIMDYMFDGKEPKGNNYVLGAFEGIQHVLDKSLKNSTNGATTGGNEPESSANRHENDFKSNRHPVTDTDTGADSLSSGTDSDTNEYGGMVDPRNKNDGEIKRILDNKLKPHKE